MTNIIRIEPDYSSVQINETDNIVNLVSGADVITATTNELAAIQAGENPTAINPFMTRSAVSPWVGIFNVKDYGALGNGVADDTAEIQSTIDAAVAAGGGKVKFPPGNYLTSAALTHTLSDVRLVFEGSGQDNTMITGGGAVMFDLCGTSSCVVRDIRFYSLTADVGILLARIAARHSAAHRFDNVMVGGTFNKACVYSICAEGNLYTNTALVNSKSSATSYSLFTSTDNDLSVTSSAGTIDDSSDGATNSTGYFIGGKMWHAGTGIALGIHGNTGQWLFTTYMASNFRGVVIDKSTHQDALNSGLTFRDCLFEGIAATGVYFNDITVNFVTLDRCHFTSTGTPESGFSIYQASVARNLIGLIIRNCSFGLETISLNGLNRSEIDCTYGLTVRTTAYQNTFVNGVPDFTGAATSYYGNVILSNPGLGLPKYSASQRSAITPYAGVFIYNTDTNQVNFYNGSAWKKIAGEDE